MSFTASPIPNAKKTFLNSNGAPLAGGSVGYYVPGTLNAKTTWADENQVTPNSTVIPLDAAGRPQSQVFGSGDYREIVKDINGVAIWDQVTNVPQVGTSVSGTELITTGNVQAGAWTTFGIRLQLQSATYTDTTSSGTVAMVVVDANNAPTISASNATTYTNAYTQYVSVPTAGANVTFTNAWALGADSLKVNGNINVASSGTVTMPDSATWNSGGITGTSLADIAHVGIRDTSAAYDVTIGATSSVALTAGRALTVDVANGARNLKLTGNATLNQDVSTAGNPTFATATTTGQLQATNLALTNGPININGGIISSLANNAAQTISTLSAGATQFVTALDGTSIDFAIAVVWYTGATLSIHGLANNGIAFQASGANLQILNSSGGTLNNIQWGIH